MPANAGSSLVFRSDEEAVQTDCFFRLTRWLHEATPLAPLRGRGCKNSSQELSARSAGSTLVFRSTHEGYHNAILFSSPTSFRVFHIYTVSKMLTHKNVTTTQIYADLVNSKKRETTNKISKK